MTTATMITPWMTVENAGSTPRKSRSARISPRMKIPMIGPSNPPRPPARLTPPSTMAATLSRRYGPGTGWPMPVLAVSASPPSAAKNPAMAYDTTFVRPTLTPLRKAASWLEPMRVEREAEPRPPQRDPDREDNHQQQDQGAG